MNKQEIRKQDERLRELTSACKRSDANMRLKEFYCPILHLEEATELCKGHIIPAAVQGRKWVVQRKDVDNFYGSFVEADFVHGVKLRSIPSFNDSVEYLLKHNLARKADLSAIDDGGALVPVFPTKKLPEGLEMMIRPEIDLIGDLSLSIDFDARYETLLTLLHSVHLGRFEMAGYTYANSRSGRFIAHLLRSVYHRFSGTRKHRHDSKNRECLVSMCQPYLNMVRPLTDVDVFKKDLFDDPFRSFIVCWCGDTIFALVHMLKAESEWNGVMVYLDVDWYAIAMMSSAVPVSFKATPGRVNNRRIEVAPVGDGSNTIVWLCGENSDATAALPIEELMARLHL